MTPNVLAAALRAKSATKSAAPLQDIFGYIDNEGTGSVAITPNQHDGGEAGWGTTGLGVNYADPQANNGADGNVAQAPIVFKPPEQFAPGVTMSMNSPNGEGSGGFHFNVDGSKFPMTQFGDVTRAAPVNAHSTLIDPRLQYNDPNYGQITFAQNVKPDRINEMAWPALIAAATAGMGALAAPAAIAGGGLLGGAFNPATLGIGLVNGAAGFGRGGLSGGLSGLLGAIGGGFGLPSWATSLGRVALAQALRNRKNGG